MHIGSPKEIKVGESRIGLVPSSVRELVALGHTVYIQKDAGISVGLHDEDYQQVGANIVDSLEEVYEKAELIIKVKEPQPSEYDLLREDHILFTYRAFYLQNKLKNG